MAKEETKKEEVKKEEVKPKIEKEEVKPKVEKKEETVEVKKSDLDRMIAQMDKQAKDIDLLYKAADKSRLATEMNRGGSENLIKQVRVWTWDDTGKYIVGWKLNSNRCEVVMGKWVEEQVASVVLEDGEVITVPLLEFYRKTLIKKPADLLSRTDEYDTNNNKITIFKVQFPNGKTLLINQAFVN